MYRILPKGGRPCDLRKTAQGTENLGLVAARRRWDKGNIEMVLHFGRNFTPCALSLNTCLAYKDPVYYLLT